MPTRTSCAPAAARAEAGTGRLRALLVVLLAFALPALAGCAAPGSGPAGSPVAAALPPMAVADASKPPRDALPLNDAVASLATSLLDRARLDPPGPSGRYTLVVDPLIDRASGVQTGTTRAMEARIGALVGARYPRYDLKRFSTATLDEKPLILLGAITPVPAAGVIPAMAQGRPEVYRIWAVIADLRTNTVVSHETAWVRAADVDPTPAGFSRESPTWAPEPVVAAYLRTCALDPGAPVDPAYVAALRAQALVADATREYEGGRFREALASFEQADQLPAGAGLSALNGVYLSSRALGRAARAEDAFGRLVAHGLDGGRLAVKFVFRPGSTAWWPDRAVSGDYPMWLRQIARQAAARDGCIEVSGHTSPTGAAALNQRLSLARARRVRGELVADAARLGPRTRAAGVGSARPIVGSGADDATDVLDRRVELQPLPCAAVTASLG